MKKKLLNTFEVQDVYTDVLKLMVHTLGSDRSQLEKLKSPYYPWSERKP